jgi:hypothetical protein
VDCLFTWLVVCFCRKFWFDVTLLISFTFVACALKNVAYSNVTGISPYISL